MQEQNEEIVEQKESLIKGFLKNLTKDPEDTGVMDVVTVDDNKASDYEQPVNKNVRVPEATMVVVQPASYEEANSIANYLLNKKACILNIHRLQQAHAVRLIDYLSGVVYAIKGSIQKVDSNVYLLSPKEQPVKTVNEETESD